MNGINKTDISAFRQSGQFDPEWYINQYPDVAASGMDPAEHYLWIGKQIGRLPSPGLGGSVTRNDQAGGSIPHIIRPKFRGFGTIKHNPLISILIVSFNSHRDLEVLFPSIANQTYRNFEVILIENGEEETESLLKQHFKNYKFMKLDNVGFAEANNVASRIANGELFALVNPDTRLATDMIQKMLDAMRYDEDAAVVVPKINFFERFIRLKISANARFSIQRTDILKKLAYKKIFVRSGESKGKVIKSDDSGHIIIDIPYDKPRSLKVALKGITNLYKCTIQIGYSQELNFIQEGKEIFSIEIPLDDDNCSSARYMINNAGSHLDVDGNPYDRGFGEFDDGAYFSKAYIKALCGCAALIRRIAIMDRDLFFGPFFAYYEDSELSYWLDQQGYRILYQPEAVVFHRHSESTEENSVSWSVLVSRSKRLYDIFTGRDPLPLAFFSFNYPDYFNGALRERLEALDERICKARSHWDLFSPPRPTACVYNSYFSSMGGGEKHALDIVNILQSNYDVYIACEKDFDLSHMESYFDINLGNVKKIICTNIDSYFTSKFDLFVNSTFQSRMISSAKKNIYIVSFPHTEASREFINGYKFLHNSNYTAEWASVFWGVHNNEVVLPILSDFKQFTLDHEMKRKMKTLLSVGRFNYDGHCKNHHLVLDIYKKLLHDNQNLASWRLKIIGSCDYSQQASFDYLQDVRRSAQGFNVEILPNAERKVLDEAYRDAAIYIQATGLGVASERPELHEHFGITTFEAMAYGCLPVVYHLGGPAAQISGLPLAKYFKDKSSFQRVLMEAIRDFEDGNVCREEIRDHARSIYQDNLKLAQKLLVENFDYTGSTIIS